MKIITYSRLIVLFFILSYCGQSPNNKSHIDVPNDWNVINESDFLIRYPKNFDLDSSGLMGDGFILFSKQTSPKDLFRENINLYTQDLKGQNINLDEFVEISTGQILRIITNPMIIENKRIKTDDHEFQKVVFSGVQGEYNLKFQQYWFINQERSFVLTLTCEINQFDNYITVGEKIMNSFRFK